MLLRILLCLLASIFIPSSAFAWSRDGHRAICQAAYDLADQTTKKEIDRLLTSMPELHRKALAEYVNIDPSEITFADSCAWADAVKRWSQYENFRHWHYINTDRFTDTYQDKDCTDGCVLTGMVHFGGVLSDHSKSDWERAQALMFLGHFIGDAHQPLHNGFADDLDGNTTKVRGAHMDCNQMHRMWDNCLIKQNGLAYKDLSRLLVEFVTDDDISSIQQGSPESWINESMAIARSPIVKYCVRQGDGSCAAIAPDNGTSYALPEDYFDQVWPIAEKRLEFASARLVMALNEHLTDD